MLSPAAATAEAAATVAAPSSVINSNSDRGWLRLILCLLAPRARLLADMAFFGQFVSRPAPAARTGSRCDEQLESGRRTGGETGAPFPRRQPRYPAARMRQDRRLCVP